jgi:hypothetical protein
MGAFEPDASSTRFEAPSHRDRIGLIAPTSANISVGVAGLRAELPRGYGAERELRAREVVEQGA